MFVFENNLPIKAEHSIVDLPYYRAEQEDNRNQLAEERQQRPHPEIGNVTYFATLGRDWVAAAAPPPPEGVARRKRFPFLVMEMLEYTASNIEFQKIASWLPKKAGDARSFFKIHDIRGFEEVLLPKFFHASSYKSFQRNLNLHHFQHAHMSKATYWHPYFHRGEMNLCDYIRRDRKNAEQKSVAIASQDQLLQSLRRHLQDEQHPASVEHELAQWSEQAPATTFQTGTLGLPDNEIVRNEGGRGGGVAPLLVESLVVRALCQNSRDVAMINLMTKKQGECHLAKEEVAAYLTKQYDHQDDEQSFSWMQEHADDLLCLSQSIVREWYHQSGSA